MDRKMVYSGYEWLGDIPEDWTTCRTKNMFNFGKGLSITKDNLVGTGTPVISYGQIHSKMNSGTALCNELIRFVPEEYLEASPDSLVKKNDFIFADTSEDLDGCGNCVFVDRSMNLFAGYHTIILRANNSAENKYFAYLFKTDAWRSQIRSKVSGVKVFSISRKILADTVLIVPSECDQRRIVDYLDCKCAVIDAVISKTNATIEEYKKLKQSIIAEAVTKGIQRNRQMKPSGVDWIGQLPADWKVQRGKRLFVETNERSIDGREELLTVSHITGVTPRSMKNVNMFMAESLVDYKVCHIGDLAANTMWMWQGAIGVSKYEGVISPSYNTYRQRNNNYYYGYLEYLLRIPNLVATYAAYSTGITASRLRLYPDQFFSIMFPVPPVSEQKEIADYLDKKCAEIDTLISKKAALLGELENYKKSIIFEYVTGKKEVQ